MGLNRKLADLAQFIDSSSSGESITKSATGVGTKAVVSSDVQGSAGTFTFTESSYIANVISASYITSKTGKATSLTGTKSMFQGSMPDLIPQASATYDLGDSAKPLAELILDSSASLFFGTGSLTSKLLGGTALDVTITVPSSQLGNSKYTMFHLGTSGAGNNNTVTDGSTTGHTVTRGDNPLQSSFSPYRHGRYSYDWNVSGSSGGIKWPTSSDWDFGTGDFTMEMWAKWPDVTAGYDALIISNGGSSTNFELYLHTGVAELSFWSGGANNRAQTTSSGITNNIWHHIAVVRNSGVLNIYVDGTSKAQNSSHTDNLTTGHYVWVGSYNGSSSYANTSMLSDVRITNTAVYTSNFTPPTERLTAIPGTKLLTCHLPYISDGSPSNHTPYTIDHDVDTTAQSPYDNVAYSASSHTGSYYFDGSNDYLSVADHSDFNFGTGDYTFELWFHPDNPDSSWQTLLSSAYNDSGSWRIYKAPGNYIRYYYNYSSYQNSSTSEIINGWHHIACVRNSGTTKTYINGIERASTSNDTNNINLGKAINIGYGGPGESSTYPFEGYITDVRITKSAVYTSNFTPPTEPLTRLANTVLLLNGNESKIFDKSQRTTKFLVDGDVNSNSTKTKFAATSVYFDGTHNEKIDCVMPSTVDFAEEPFTVEGWVNFSDLSASRTMVCIGDNQFFYRSSSSAMAWYDGATSRVYSTGNPSTDTWYHFAYVRSGNDVELFWNGTSAGTQTTSISWANEISNGEIRVGAWSATGEIMHGYIEDLRITFGLARYTDDFTPPTASLEG